MFVGSSLGGAVPMLWGGDAMSVVGVCCGLLGGVVGIWGGYRLGRSF